MRLANTVMAAAAFAASTAVAADAIKAGKWEFSAQVQLPNTVKLPPGVQLPPGVNIGAGGINVVKTTCVDQATPMPADMRPPNQQHGQCKTGNVVKNGGTVTWEVTCPQSDGSVVHSDGVAHYTGDTMEATMKTRVTGGTGGISETSQHITGRYLGACDAK
ncbi:MAG TPA: DUF3617 family protein [Stellaceae bacterium]|nr:DUF3617 family protein [Stellaceae bacterium]